jgi:hypothetical protein
MISSYETAHEFRCPLNFKFGSAWRGFCHVIDLFYIVSGMNPKNKRSIEDFGDKQMAITVSKSNKTKNATCNNGSSHKDAAFS